MTRPSNDEIYAALRGDRIKRTTLEELKIVEKGIDNILETADKILKDGGSDGFTLGTVCSLLAFLKTNISY